MTDKKPLRGHTTSMIQIDDAGLWPGGKSPSPVEPLIGTLSVHPEHAAALAFRLLFPDAKSPLVELPVAEHDVFVLDIGRTTEFVHNARYNSEYQNFVSDTGWFETPEVYLWAYAPNIKHANERFAFERLKESEKMITLPVLRTPVHLRNDANRDQVVVPPGSTELLFFKDALSAHGKVNTVLAKMCGVFDLVNIDVVDSLTLEMANSVGKLAISELQVLRVIDYGKFICDDSNNPPDKRDGETLIFTAAFSVPGTLGHFQFSFSNKDL